eukprot:m.11254 g.11254  ORF g.11254 m.11254 type:complete len:668 (+) comp8728_c0_seq1:47-2050(+)
MVADLILCNGRVVDGTGELPAFVADVAVSSRSGLIVDIGGHLVTKYPQARTIDVSNNIITPGFVDIHTHFDAQVFWDPLLSPSTGHGVTTVVFGNCGVGFAPCRTKDRGFLLSALEGVEDIPGVVMTEGMTWSWESYKDYMDTLSSLDTAADFMTFLGHVPLRVFVMGTDRCHGPATDNDLVKMRTVVADAIRFGAAGVSTSRTLMHRDVDSNIIPGTYALRNELIALYSGMADAGGGLFEILEDFADMGRELDWIKCLSLAFHIPASIAFPGNSAKQRTQLCNFLESTNAQSTRCSEEGNDRKIELMTAQSSLKHQGSLQQIGAPYHPLLGYSYFQRHLAHLPRPEQLRQLKDPNVKKKILSQKSVFDGTPFAKAMFSPSNLFPLVPPCANNDRPLYERDHSRESFAALAEHLQNVDADECSEDAMSLVYDALADGHVLWSPLTGHANLDDRVELFNHPHVKVGLGDGGAHLGILQEASGPTYMISHFVRDRTCGEKISIERAVYLQTLDTSRVMGLRDRGVIKIGMRADLNVIDMNKLELKKPEFRKDLPAGGGRWYQDADGYVLTMVKGVITFRMGVPTGALPGGLVRGQLRHQLCNLVRTREQIPDAELEGPEPVSTHDIVEDKLLKGGASALARAAKANMLSQVGDFLSGTLRTKAQQLAKL